MGSYGLYISYQGYTNYIGALILYKLLALTTCNPQNRSSITGTLSLCYDLEYGVNNNDIWSFTYKYISQKVAGTAIKQWCRESQVQCKLFEGGDDSTRGCIKSRKLSIDKGREPSYYPTVHVCAFT
jgi:hypothetical protein